MCGWQDNKKLSDNQVFLIFVTDTLRKQYEQKMLRQVEQVRACTWRTIPMNKTPITPPWLG